MMPGNRLEVPKQTRELVIIGIDNTERAFALFFDQATSSVAPNSAERNCIIETRHRRQVRLRTKSRACCRPHRSDRIAVCILSSAGGNHDRTNPYRFGLDDLKPAHGLMAGQQ